MTVTIFILTVVCLVTNVTCALYIIVWRSRYFNVERIEKKLALIAYPLWWFSGLRRRVWRVYVCWCCDVWLWENELLRTTDKLLFKSPTIRILLRWTSRRGLYWYCWHLRLSLYKSFPPMLWQLSRHRNKKYDIYLNVHLLDKYFSPYCNQSCTKWSAFCPHVYSSHVFVQRCVTWPWYNQSEHSIRVTWPWCSAVLQLKQVCDGIIDCVGGEDERGCPDRYLMRDYFINTIVIYLYHTSVYEIIRL